MRDYPIGLAVELGWRSPWRLRRNIRRILEAPFIRLRMRLAGVEVGSRSRLFGAPIIQRYRPSIIRLGDDVELRSSRRSNVLGLAHPVFLTTLRRDAVIDIGNDVGLSGASVCAASRISIGSGTLIGADALITDTDHHPLYGLRGPSFLKGAAVAPIAIGKNVFIGAKAIILKGSIIEDGAVIGAGAVVSGRVPACGVMVGNPCRLVGSVGGDRHLAPEASLPGERAAASDSQTQCRVVVATPNGVDYVLSVARAAQAVGRLERIFVSFTPPQWMYAAARLPIGRFRPRAAAWLNRRAQREIEPSALQPVGQLHELMRVAAVATMPRAQSTIAALMYRGKEVFDKSVARRLPATGADVVVAHYASARDTLAMTKALGRTAALVFENSHPSHHNLCLKELGGLREGHQELIPPAVARRVEDELEIADLVFVPSHYVRRQLEQRGVRKDKIVLEPYGVDPVRFRPSPDRVAVARTGRRRCLFIGQIAHRKGIAVLLEAARRLETQRVDFVLIGPVVSPELVARVPGNVRWSRTVGHDQVATEMQHADIFVLPSLDDAYPLVTLEAMSAGLPVITTDHAGTSELISDGEDGLVVPAGEVAGTVDAIVRLLDDEQLRLAMGRAARRRIEKAVTWEAYGQHLLERLSAASASSRLVKERVTS